MPASFRAANAGQDRPSVIHVDERSEARQRVVDTTARVLAEAGKLEANGPTGAILGAAIKHQYDAGGTAAVDSLPDDINKALPPGMKLVVKDDPEFARKVTDYYRQRGEQPPPYIKVWELQKDGVPAGKMGVTLNAKGQSI
jgi:hypothetical protein